MLNAALTYGTSDQTVGWWEGDFNFDGRFNINDLIALAAAGLYGAGGYLPAGGGVLVAADVGLVAQATDAVAAPRAADPLPVNSGPVLSSAAGIEPAALTAAGFIADGVSLSPIDKAAWAVLASPGLTSWLTGADLRRRGRA